jgi:hypothetical protein
MIARTATGWTMGRAVGVVAVAGLLVYWFLQPAALALKSLAFVLVGVAVISPVAGLLAFAGLAPLSTTIAALCGAPGMGAQLLELMALGAGAGVAPHRADVQEAQRRAPYRHSGAVVQPRLGQVGVLRR